MAVASPGIPFTVGKAFCCMQPTEYNCQTNGYKADDKTPTQCSIVNKHLTINLAIKGLTNYQTIIKTSVVIDILLLPR